jgi:hypothetical protein
MEFTKVGCLELFSRRTPLKEEEGGREKEEADIGIAHGILLVALMRIWTM